MRKLKQIKEDLKTYINDENILCIYLFGSIVYETYREGISDIDCIFVLNHTLAFPEPIFKIINGQAYHFNCVSNKEWMNQQQNYTIETLECFYFNKKFVLKEMIEWENYKPLKNKELVRKSISTIASHSYVKAKKKFVVEKTNKDIIIGKKSIWHSLRILDFGCQIFIEGSILEFHHLNDIYQNILKLNCWDEIEEYCKPIYKNKKHLMKIAYENL